MLEKENGQMKKIAILTLFYKNYNYGGLLQGYALKNTIDSFEESQADVLRYKDGINPIYSGLKQQIRQYGPKMFASKIIEKGMEKCTFLISKKIQKRFVLCDEFIEECVNQDGVEYTDENIAKTLDMYDCYISGSDQVWNPNCIRNGFLQTFVSDCKKKISYAASIGRGKLTDRESDIIAENVNKFDYISVRENDAKNILQEKVNKEINVVSDPVFLPEVDIWNFEAKVKGVKPDKYVLFYSFSDSRKYRNKAEKYCKRNNLKLLYIPYAKQKFNLFDNTGAGEKLYDVGPKEFVWLIKNAKCIYTDSFHGVAFSIILNKEFYVFERDNKYNNTSMNSRIYNLLERFSLGSRIITLENFQKPEECSILYDGINQKIIKYREESLDFLKKAIEDKER